VFERLRSPTNIHHLSFTEVIMRSESVTSIVVLFVFLFLLTLTSCAYKVNVTLPLDMANKGFCYQTVLVPAVAGQHGSSYSAYAPCKKGE
jgi:hypothetical protein